MARITKYQIAIAGWAGTGTTSAAKGVLNRLGGKWRIVRPASDTFREMAIGRYPNMEAGAALALLERDACADLSIDEACDQALAKLAMSEEFFIVDARLGALFAPDALRVLLYCDNNALRYRRVASREGLMPCTAANQTIDREASARERYMKLYGTTVEDLEYDLRINTASTSEPEVVDLIVSKFLQHVS